MIEPVSMMPLSREASAVIGLKVEPVGYVAAIARLNSGAPLASELSWSNLPCEIGLANRFASKEG
jgi:hypothetical protein